MGIIARKAAAFRMELEWEHERAAVDLAWWFTKYHQATVAMRIAARAERRTERRNDMITDVLTNATVKAAIEALQDGDRTAWSTLFEPDAELYDDGSPRSLQKF